MAVPYLFITKIDPKSPDDVTTATTGGTLAGASAVLTVAYNDASFTKAEGKERLILALERITDYLKETKTTWVLS